VVVGEAVAAVEEALRQEEEEVIEGEEDGEYKDWINMVKELAPIV